MSGAVRRVRGLVSKKKKRFQEDGFDLDLTYVTSRIIAMGFPSVGTEGVYRNPLPEVQRFFNSRHRGRFRVYNLCSERSYEPDIFEGRAVRFPFDDHNPCPLHVVGEFCKDVDAWLSKNAENVVAIHCKAGKGRTGLMISAYLVHSGIQPTAAAALEFFGLQRTSNGKGVTIPSQMRYVHYYEHLLRCGPSPTYRYRITHMRFHTVPNMDLGGGCQPYFTLHCHGEMVFSYKDAMKAAGQPLRRFKKNEAFVDLPCGESMALIEGDTLLRFHHLGAGNRSSKMCHLWIHTAYISQDILTFGRSVVDKACKDKGRVFDLDFKVEILLKRVDKDGKPVKVMPRYMSILSPPSIIAPPIMHKSESKADVTTSPRSPISSVELSASSLLRFSTGSPKSPVLQESPRAAMGSKEVRAPLLATSTATDAGPRAPLPKTSKGTNGVASAGSTSSISSTSSASFSSSRPAASTPHQELKAPAHASPPALVRSLPHSSTPPTPATPPPPPRSSSKIDHLDDGTDFPPPTPPELLPKPVAKVGTFRRFSRGLSSRLVRMRLMGAKTSGGEGPDDAGREGTACDAASSTSEPKPPAPLKESTKPKAPKAPTSPSRPIPPKKIVSIKGARNVGGMVFADDAVGDWA